MSVGVKLGDKRVDRRRRGRFLRRDVRSVRSFRVNKVPYVSEGSV